MSVPKNITARVNIPGAIFGAVLGALFIVLMDVIFGPAELNIWSVAFAYFLGNVASILSAWSNRDKAADR